MKNFFWILLIIAKVVSAQELDSVAVDTAEVEPPPYYLGIYLQGGASFESSAPNFNFLSQVGLGVQYQRWMVSFVRNDFRGKVQSFVVFPNAFELKYSYGGFRIVYQFYEKKWLDMMISGGYFKGDMLWRNKEDGQDFIRDEFDLMKVGLAGEISSLRYIKPYLILGYQRMKNLNLSRVDENDFSGLFVGAGIRIGYFNQ